MGDEESGCVFCRIAHGDAPAHVVLREERVLAFLDIYPSSRGHVLVIPTRHAPTIWDLTDDEAGAILRAARRIAGALKEAFAPAGLNLLQSNGEVAGQQVFHFHLHLIPRYGGDEGLRFRLRSPDFSPPPAAELAAVAEQVRRALAR